MDLQAKVAGDLRKLHTKELHDTNTLTNHYQMIETRRIR